MTGDKAFSGKLIDVVVRDGKEIVLEGEEIELVRVPLAEVPALLAEVEDSKTLAGLLLLLRNRG